MSPSHVLEPTYLRLKAKLKDGAWPLGMRLEAARLADELGVSITPVRDSLNRLVGERLVEQFPGDGFRVARLNERVLRDLFAFNRDMLISAFSPRPVAIAGPDDAVSGDKSYAVRVADLFLRVAAAARNAILLETVGAVNDRLHAVRRLDRTLLPSLDEELADLEALLGEGSTSKLLARALEDYHGRRVARAQDYISILEQIRKPV